MDEHRLRKLARIDEGPAPRPHHLLDLVEGIFKTQKMMNNTDVKRVTKEVIQRNKKASLVEDFLHEWLASLEVDLED